MQKVVFSVTKSGKFSTKSTGIGYIDNENLYVPALSQKGKPYIRVFNCIKNCHQITNRPDEFKGEYYEIREVEIETKNSTGQHTGFETREVEISYYIWFKKVSEQSAMAL